MTPILECERLTKRYGGIVALKEISLSVQPGVVGLLGPNGAGKSTLISVLLGQAPATSGSATVLGLNIRRRQRAIRRRVGFVPENDCLIPGMSGTGYVYYCGRLAGMSHADAMQRAHEVLDYVGMEEARYRPAEQYSAGMKQRLKLAQALVHDPDVLFLDEPTNGMDPQGRQVMLSLISDLGRAGISVLLSSHLLPDVERVCERVIIMGGGEVLTEGRLDDMNKPHPTLYRVDFTGDAATFRRRLTDSAVLVLEQVDGCLQIALPEEGSQRLVLQAARDTGTKVLGLQPKRSSLEETFMAAIQRQQQA
ncbi:MAG: ABC transporter ATP-binding protein [Phycisphaerales bacterium]|nr:ABC transporter ATP-binding protein [Phycisphaerales bacterium]